MKVLKVLLLLFVLALSVASPHLSAKPIKAEFKPLDWTLEVLEDKSGELTIEGVRQSSMDALFIAYPGQSLHFGLSDSAFWIRITVTPERTGQWFLEINHHYLDFVDFYYPPASQTKPVITGRRRPFSTRAFQNEHFIFPLSLKRTQNDQFYLRIKATYQIEAPIRLSSVNQLQNKLRWRSIEFGILMGFFTTISFGLMIFYVLTRQKILIYELGATLCGALFVFDVKGYIWTEFFFQEMTSINFKQFSYIGLLGVFIALSGFSYFSRYFKLSTIKVGIWITLGLLMSVLSLILEDPNLYLPPFSFLYFAGLTIVFGGMLFSLHRKKERISKLVVLALILMIFIQVTSLFAFPQMRVLLVSFKYTSFASSLYCWLMVMFFFILFLKFSFETYHETRTQKKEIEVLKNKKIELVNRMLEMMETRNKNYNENRNELSLLNDKERETIDFIKQNQGKIGWIKSEKNYCKVYLENETEFIEQKIRISQKLIKKHFPGNLFFQTHKSYLVKQDKVQGYQEFNDAYHLIINHQHSVPVGPKYVASVKAVFIGKQ